MGDLDPVPNPRPNPEPVPPPEEEGQEYNRKKLALKAVRDELEIAESDLGADAAAYGEMPKSAKLTEGLGDDGSVWQSTLAETTREDLVGIIDAITSKVSDTYDDVDAAWSAEPDYVAEGDSRARWGVR